MGKVTNKRERLLESAAKLFHQAGFHKTSIADISEDSGVPLGNVYYYFKTKDDLVSAIIEQRKNTFKSWAAEWEKIPDPKERLFRLIEFQISMKDKIAQYGCPMGSLCQELDKDGQASSQEADGLLRWHLQWITDQFRQIGREDAEPLAIQMVATEQGICIVGNALNDANIIEVELERLKSWIREM